MIMVLAIINRNMLFFVIMWKALKSVIFSCDILPKNMAVYVLFKELTKN